MPEDALTPWPVDATPPNTLDIDAIERTHRGARENVVFMALNAHGKGMKTIASIGVPELRTMLPGFVDALLRDGYCTVNTFRPPYRDRAGRMAYRRKPDVHELCSCYSDLDCYKLGMNFLEGRAALDILVAQNVIPDPSVLVRSGRGLYAFWLLRPIVRPTRELLDLYDQTQRRLWQVLAPLGADPRALDACRPLRAPGSYHTKAKQRTHYTFNYEQNGAVLAYGLPELLDFLSVPVLSGGSDQARREHHARALPTITATPAGEPMPRGALVRVVGRLPGGRSPERYSARARVVDLCRIAEVRGGIAEGCRHFYLWRYAEALCAAGVRDRLELQARIAEVNEKVCRPPQTMAEVRDACRGASLPPPATSGQGWRQTRSDTIARELGVTSAEASALGLVSIMPTEEREARQAARRQARDDRQAIRDAQRQALKSILAEFKSGRHRRPGREHLAEEIAERTGHPVSGQTIGNWLRELGVKPNRRGRPRTRG